MGASLRRVARSLVPDGLKRTWKRSGFYLRHRSEATNVYHCCVQRTASRWIQRILRDDRIYRHCGLRVYDYHREGTGEEPDSRPPNRIRISEAFPRGTMASPLYLDLAGYRSIPKPERYRTFFVMRDPRDIVVSWYHAMKVSHDSLDGALDDVRRQLRSRGTADGLKHAIDLLGSKAGLFDALESWVDADGEEPHLILVRYEDLTGSESASEFGRIMDHCDIAVPDPLLEAVLEDVSFERMSGGRRRGEEDVDSHYRKGVAGDWRNHLTSEILRHYHSVAGDLAARLGYEPA